MGEKSRNDVNKLDDQLKELESKMKDLKQKKINIIDKKIQKYECEKQKLEEDINKEVKIKEEKENTIATEMTNLERKLNDAEISIRNLLKVTKNNTMQRPVEPNKDLLEFIGQEELERLREKKDQVIAYS